jgi:hypothetical protein
VSSEEEDVTGYRKARVTFSFSTAQYKRNDYETDVLIYQAYISLNSSGAVSLLDNEKMRVLDNAKSENQ